MIRQRLCESAPPGQLRRYAALELPMNSIPNFEDAVESFRHFLTENGHPSEVFWVFRDDIWKRPNDVLVNYYSASRNFALAQKVFSEGHERGLVEVHAVATAGNSVAATVWFPKFPNEQVQGWDCGMKLSISQPLPRATIVGPFRWFFFRFVPLFRHYQETEWTIGTKSWAAGSCRESPQLHILKHPLT